MHVEFDLFIVAIVYLMVGAVFASILIGFGPDGTRTSALGRAAMLTVGWLVLPFVVAGLGLGIVIRRARKVNPLD